MLVVGRFFPWSALERPVLLVGEKLHGRGATKSFDNHPTVFRLLATHRGICTVHINSYNMSIESVQCFGRKKTATAVAFVKKGTGLIKVNGVPISLLQPEILKLKTFEPVLLIGTDKFSQVSHWINGINCHRIMIVGKNAVKLMYSKHRCLIRYRDAND